MPTRRDGLVNCVTGLGDPEIDIRQQTQRTWARWPTVWELEQEWCQNWMAHREVSQPAGDTYREGLELTDVQPADLDMSAVPAYIQGTVTPEPDGSIQRDKGLLWYAWQLKLQGDKVGGAALFPILDDGLDPREPLDWRRIQRVVGWEVLDRSEITPFQSHGYGAEPEYFVLSDVLTTPSPNNRRVGGGKSIDRERAVLRPGDVIHRSRLAFNLGRPGLSRREQRYRQFWGLSVLELARRERFAVEEGSEYARTYMHRASWLHMQIAELNEIRATKDEAGNEIGDAYLAKHMAGVRQMASTLGMVVTDGGKVSAETRDGKQLVARPPDKLESISESVGDLPELIQGNLDQWQSAIAMPKSIAFGDAPSGLRGGDNAGDWQSWQGKISTEQSAQHEVINWMLLILFASREGPTKGRIPAQWKILWNPLVIPSPKEVAEIGKIHAETDSIRIKDTVVTPGEVKNQRLVRGDVDGPLRADPPEEDEVVEKDTGQPPAQVGIAQAVLAGGIAVSEGTATPEWYALYLGSIDTPRYPPDKAAELAAAASIGGPPAVVAGGVVNAVAGEDQQPADVHVEDAAPDPVAEALADLRAATPTDLKTPREIADALTLEHGFDISQARVKSLAAKYGVEGHTVLGKRGFSQRAIDEAYLRDRGAMPDAPTDDTPAT